MAWTINELIARLEDDRREYGGEAKVIMSSADVFCHADFGVYSKTLGEETIVTLIPYGKYLVSK